MNNIPGMGNMLKQMQKMQEDMKKAEDDLANTEVTGKAGIDLVEVTLECRNKTCKRVRLNPSLKEEEFEIIEDLIVAALNDANNQADEVKQEKLGGVTNGLKLPTGLDSLLK